MTIKYLDSKRLEGVAGDLTSPSLTSGTGGWKEVGRTTLGSANANILVDSLPDKRYYMILYADKGQASTGAATRNCVARAYCADRTQAGGEGAKHLLRS